MNEEARKYLAEIGRRGGKVKSAAKTAAARRNGRKPKTKNQKTQ